MIFGTGEANLKATNGGKVNWRRIHSITCWSSFFQIYFYKNGVNQGLAFKNINEGNLFCGHIDLLRRNRNFLFASFSMTFVFLQVSANFGPNFVHPPSDSSVPWNRWVQWFFWRHFLVSSRFLAHRIGSGHILCSCIERSSFSHHSWR